MAKLSSYYTLCPLIDQQSLLGVKKDSEPGCAIVTLGRNIVIRYKLQDLKQVTSWSSKERLTTHVIYDQTTSRYAAVFNENHVRVWTANDTDLDKVKRHKFAFPLHTILTSEGHVPVLVQENGATASLEWALKNRKSWSSSGVLKKDEKMTNCELVTVNGKSYLCTMIKLENASNYLVVALRNETYLEEADHVKRIELKRTSEELVGHVVVQDKNNAYLLTLWSHGRLYSYNLTSPSAESVPGTLVSVLTALSTKHPVVMTPLNETTLAVYGADVLEEGAVLMIYNIQFKLTQAVQKLKLYTKDAKLWKVEDKLLLAANRHLAVAPYRLASQRIETMLGSSLRFEPLSSSNKEDNEVMVVQESTIADWEGDGGKPSKFPLKGLPHKIAKQISALVNEGMSDAVIQQTLIPQLIESRDTAAIIWFLDNFKDLSEKLLVDLLSFCLRTPDKAFVPTQNGFDTDKPKTDVRRFAKNRFLDKVLSASYSDVCLLSHLKAGLNFNEILKLLEYLIEKLDITENCVEDSSEPSEGQFLEWAIMLLDSHYQHYLLSRDPEVLNLLNRLSSILEEHFELIQNLQNLRPMLQRISRGKPLKPAPKNTSKFYSIEEVKLY